MQMFGPVPMLAARLSRYGIAGWHWRLRCPSLFISLDPSDPLLGTRTASFNCNLAKRWSKASATRAFAYLMRPMHQFSRQSNNPTRTRRIAFYVRACDVPVGDPYRCCSYCLFRNSVPPTSLMFGPIRSIVGTPRLIQLALRYSY